MSAAENRKLAEELFARLGAGDVHGALATLTQDATWRVEGVKEVRDALHRRSLNRERR